MRKLVIRLPDGLYGKLEEAAGEEDMLPADWVRSVLRETFEAEEDQEEGEDEGESEDEEEEADEKES